MALQDGRALLARLRTRLAADGLHIALPLGAADFDRAVRPVGGPTLAELLEGGRAAIIVGDGGPAFFDSFWRGLSGGKGAGAGLFAPGGAAVASPDPLDDHTRQVVNRAVAEAWGGTAGEGGHRILYPFVETKGAPALPFQRLGAAAGLAEPGPLGLQIHPTYGPWWAYRAAIIISLPLQVEATLASPCTGCSRPCVATCPGQAVLAAGFSYPDCVAHRATAPACRESCAARLACPVGLPQRYSDQQVAFHMKASWDLPKAAHRPLTGR